MHYPNNAPNDRATDRATNQPLHDDEQHAPAIVVRLVAGGAGQVTLSATGRVVGQRVGLRARAEAVAPERVAVVTPARDRAGSTDGLKRECVCDQVE